MQAYGYIRVSTDRQAEEGVSLEAQEAKINAWCLANDAEAAGMFVDAGLSGKRADNRPGLQQALAAACATGGCLVVYSLSRLARSTRDAIDIADQLDRSGVDLVSLSEKIDTTTAAGKCFFRMMAVFAEFERDQLAERVTMGLAQKKARGEKTGGQVPYGWQVADTATGRLEPNPVEQQMIAMARRWQAEGLSLRKIGAALASDGYLPRTGGQWHAETVKALLTAELAA